MVVGPNVVALKRPRLAGGGRRGGEEEVPQEGAEGEGGPGRYQGGEEQEEGTLQVHGRGKSTQ